jgi:hypothetical protein
MEVDLAITHQGRDDAHRLLEPTDAVIERVPEGHVFGVVPPGAQTEDQSFGRGCPDSLKSRWSLIQMESKPSASHS